MKKLLILSTALSTVAFSASADLTVMSWGGAYGAAQTEAHVKPFAASSGIATMMIDSDDPSGPIKAMVEAGNVTVDVASLEYAAAVRMCDEGLLEPIDIAMLPAGADGTPAIDDFLPGAVIECGVSTDIWANIYAYDTTKLTGTVPTTAGDFFDLEKFPGKRGLRKGAKGVLEFALMGDGVAPADVYATLATPEGLDRAFAKLDSIKSEVIWWEAGAQPPQLLADGEVVMTSAWNGRIANAIKEGKTFKIVWDGQAPDLDMWAIPKGTPNLEKSYEYLAFASSAEVQSALAPYIPYGPTNLDAVALVDAELAKSLPTHPDNLKAAIPLNPQFWGDNGEELRARFNTWLAQ